MLSPLVMGNEFSGVVEKVGANVTGFAVGDRVYGRMPLGKIGAFAEFAAVDAGALAHVPDYLSLEEAATVPLTSLNAMQSFELMDAKPGRRCSFLAAPGPSARWRFRSPRAWA